MNIYYILLTFLRFIVTLIYTKTKEMSGVVAQKRSLCQRGSRFVPEIIEVRPPSPEPLTQYFIMYYVFISLLFRENWACIN